MPGALSYSGNWQISSIPSSISQSKFTDLCHVVQAPRSAQTAAFLLMGGGYNVSESFSTMTCGEGPERKPSLAGSGGEKLQGDNTCAGLCRDQALICSSVQQI